MKTFISEGCLRLFLRGVMSLIPAVLFFLILFSPTVMVAQNPENISEMPVSSVQASDLSDSLAQVSTGLDTVWMLLAAMLVFFMQPGFAMVEAGFARCKNTANILMKNLVDFMVGSILFWIVGFGLMFGPGGFVGTPHWCDLEFMDSIISNGLPIEGFLIFQTVFCATSATIVSGAMAERTKFSMYMIYTIVISVLIYPVSGHWTWGGGWLSNAAEGSFMGDLFGISFHDFAGSAVVHSVGWIERSQKATCSGVKKPLISEWNVPYTMIWNVPL